MSELSHFDEKGASRMVDVSAKPITDRVAKAAAYLSMRPETLQRIQQRDLAKGDVLEVARIAGIMATKQTPQLIPLCHSIPISGVTIEFEIEGNQTLRIETTVRTAAQTGVEMEALTAASVTALTVYDMCKSIDRAMSIKSVQLLEKRGGKSGHFVRESE